MALGAAMMLTAATLLTGGAASTASAAEDGAALARSAEMRLHELTKVPTGWTGNTQTCDPGTESAASTSATLEGLNILRAAAGLQPVTFDPTLNSKALAAAVMMAAANNLSHAPGQDWPCYSTIGADAAARSSLALSMTGASAMFGYVIDAGVASLGHRRWALNPTAVALGSASTNTTNALWAITDTPGREIPADTVVAWPPASWVTSDWVPQVWSVSVGDGKTHYTWANGVATTAERIIGTPVVTLRIDGQPPITPAVTELQGGFGTGRTFAWTPDLAGLNLNQGDHTIGVTITGLQIRVSDQPPSYRALPISYSVSSTPSPIHDVTPMPGPVPTLTVSATAIHKASHLRVNIDPDRAGVRFKFWVQRQNSKGHWSKAGTYKTKGSSLTRTVNRKRGTYRVVVPAQHGYGQVMTGPVRLKR